jgi:hypothetical protein
MNAHRFLRFLLAVLVTAGLTVAPLVIPTAMGHSTGAMQMADAQGMLDDMRCCPDQQDQKAKDCGSCPFIALCMLTITMPTPHSAGVLVGRDFSRSAFSLPDDLLIDGLGEHPPDHPPRTIV